MSAAVNEQIQQDGCGTIVNLGLTGKNSRKLFGYDFVKYRPDCESSNANGMLKFNDVVNFGRRICESDPNAHNCVMCGEFDVVIPTQNKDVCKACDSSFWYNSMLNVAFKFCKGCKNFVTLEMFSDKPDASKCDRCRRRGRENYLTKKYIGVQDTCSTPGVSTESPPTVSPVLSTGEQIFAGFNYTYGTVTSPSVSTPASVLCSFHKSSEDTGKKPSHLSQPITFPMNFVPTPQTATKPSNKRSLSADMLLTNPAEVVVAFYASIPAKPPKTPRSVSYSSEPPRPMVTPRSDLPQPLPRSLNILNTPRGRRTNTVTPASYTSQESASSGGGGSSSGHGQDSLSSSGSGSGTGSSGGSSRSVRFARSDSMCSTDGADSEDASDGQSHYLWDRNYYGKGSPQAVASASTPQQQLHSYVPQEGASHTILSHYAANYSQTGKPSASLGVESSAVKTSDKENNNYSSQAGFAMLHNSCARLFSDAMHRESQNIDHFSQHLTRRPEPQEDKTRKEAEGEVDRRDESDGRDLCIVVSPSTSESAPLSPDESVPGSHCKDLRRLGSIDAGDVPKMMTTSPDLLYLHATSASASATSTQVVASNVNVHESCQASDGTDAKTTSDCTQVVSEKRQWEWDPSLNPLMHLAMITERI